MSKLSWMLEEVGMGVTEPELYGVQLQLKKLGEDPSLKLKHVRFFGKVYGLHYNYYVFEATPEEPDAPVPETAEGALQLTVGDAEQDWRGLPPCCLKLASSCRKRCSGSRKGVSSGAWQWCKQLQVLCMQFDWGYRHGTATRHSA
jgi:hypothetical protein